MKRVSVFLGKQPAPVHTLDGQLLAGMPKQKNKANGRKSAGEAKMSSQSWLQLNRWSTKQQTKKQDRIKPQ